MDSPFGRMKQVPSDFGGTRNGMVMEYTYALCWKMLKRCIEEDAPVPGEVDNLSFRELIRAGAEQGLISDPESWFEYRDKRDLTAHTYSQATAEVVLAAARRLAKDARALPEKLHGGAR